MVHTIPAKIIQHERALPVCWKMRILDDLQSALLRLAGTQSAQCALRTRRCLEDTAREDEIDPLPARAIAGEALTPTVEFEAPRVDQSFADDLRPPCLRPELPHPAPHQPPYTVRRLHVRVNVDRLQKVQHPLRAPAEGVQQMVRVLRAETAQQDRALVRLQIPVRILQKQHLRRIRHIQTPITWHQRRRNVQSIGKGRRFVRLAVAIRILQHHHLVLRRLARLDVRIGRTAHHPKAAFGIPVHLHRFLNHRL